MEQGRNSGRLGSVAQLGRSLRQMLGSPSAVVMRARAQSGGAPHPEAAGTGVGLTRQTICNLGRLGSDTAQPPTPPVTRQPSHRRHPTSLLDVLSPATLLAGGTKVG